jgi:PPOX class probable F420-dependent enzyme
MDLEEARSFLRDNHRAVLATTRTDGKPQLSPITTALSDDGKVWISSRETAYKVRNLRRQPYASICALNDAFFGQWIQVEGAVTIISLPDAMEMLVEYYRRVSGEHPDWDDYRAAMERDQRVMIAIDIERVGPSKSG